MSPQYVFVMKELNKIWPGGKQIIKNVKEVRIGKI